MSEGNAACNNPDTTDYMRRCDLSRMTPEERLIHDAMYAVEKIPAADVRLTEVTGLLFAARTRLADYVDGITGHTTHPVQCALQRRGAEVSTGTARVWLIESPGDESNPPRWYRYDANNKPWWHRDANKATWFVRREDAESAIARGQFLRNTKATEHVFAEGIALPGYKARAI